MSDKDEILAKIKKCLALSKSSNEHEAAAALRQAKKLMEAHNISDLDVQAAEAEEHLAAAGATRKPTAWEAYLAGEIAAAFSCRLVFLATHGSGKWSFIGLGASAEVAGYAFAVLFRQAKRARAAYIKERLARCKRGAQVRRADLFCHGWVETATAQVGSGASTEQQAVAIDAFIASRYPALVDASPRDRTGDRKLRDHEWSDHSAGRRAGHDAQLNRGVNAANNLALEGR